MRAVVLAGGKGTRLLPYTTVIPKPLVPVGDRPILEILLRQLARAGVESVDLCVGHLGELIRAYFSEAVQLPLELKYHWEGEPLGTAGALRGIPDLRDTFFVLNGDVLCSMDFGELWRAHRESGTELTIAATEKEVPIDLGVIEHKQEQVSAYIEKPRMSYTVSMGIYVYEPSVLELIGNGRLDFPDVVHMLLDQGRSVRVHRFNGEWFDIGTPEDHERASQAIGLHPDLYGE